MLGAGIRIAPDEGLAQLRGIVVEKGLNDLYRPGPPPRLQPRPAAAEDLREASIWERAERVIPSEEWHGTEYQDALYWLSAASSAYREQLLWALTNRSIDVSGSEGVQELRVLLFRW